MFYFSNIVKRIHREKNSNRIDMWKSEFNTAITEVLARIEATNVYKRALYYICGDMDRGLGYTDLGKSLFEYVYDEMYIDFICNRFEINRLSAESVLEIDLDIIVIGGIYQQYLLIEN